MRGSLCIFIIIRQFVEIYFIFNILISTKRVYNILYMENIFLLTEKLFALLMEEKNIAFFI